MGLGGYMNPIGGGETTSSSPVPNPSERTEGPTRIPEGKLSPTQVSEILDRFDAHIKANSPGFDRRDQRERFEGFLPVVRTALEKRLHLPSENWNVAPDDLNRVSERRWTLVSPEFPTGESVRAKVVIDALENAHREACSRHGIGVTPTKEPEAPTAQPTTAEGISVAVPSLGDEALRNVMARLERTLDLIEGNLEPSRIARSGLASDVLKQRGELHTTDTGLQDRLDEIERRSLKQLRSPVPYALSGDVTIALGESRAPIFVTPSLLLSNDPKNERWVLGEDNRAALSALLFERSKDKRTAAVQELTKAFDAREGKRGVGEVLKAQELYLLMVACTEGYAGTEALPLIAQSRKLFEIIAQRNYSDGAMNAVEVLRDRVVGFLLHHAQLDFLSIYERTQFVKALHAFAPEAISSEVDAAWRKPENEHGLGHGGRAFALIALKLGYATTAYPLTPSDVLGRALTEDGVDLEHPLAELGLDVLTSLNPDTDPTLLRGTLRHCVDGGIVQHRRVALSAIRGLGRVSHLPQDITELQVVAKSHPEFKTEVVTACKEIKERVDEIGERVLGSPSSPSGEQRPGDAARSAAPQVTPPASPPSPATGEREPVQPRGKPPKGKDRAGAERTAPRELRDYRPITDQELDDLAAALGL